LQAKLETVRANFIKVEQALTAAETEKENLERETVSCRTEVKELEQHKAECEDLLKKVAKQRDVVKKQKSKLEKEAESRVHDIAKMEKVWSSHPAVWCFFASLHMVHAYCLVNCSREHNYGRLSWHSSIRLYTALIWWVCWLGAAKPQAGSALAGRMLPATQLRKVCAGCRTFRH
jgi:hypothetical protein